METLEIFKKQNGLPHGTRVIDAVPHALYELALLRDPRLKFAPRETAEKRRAAFTKKYRRIPSVFAYYPWKKVAVRIPQEAIYFELRTARNKNIITEAEQKRYRNLLVGIVGLSVGSNVLSALVLGGGPQRMKIADYDIVEISNLNRMRASLDAVGINKAVVAARAVWETDPFTKLEVWEKGVRPDTLARFITGSPRLDVFIDEMDDLGLKIRSRMICKRYGIPVLMATDNGDNVILDIERFDKEPKRPILHGLVDGIDPETLNSVSYAEWLRTALRVVGKKNLTPRVKQSLRSIGKSIAGVPQLGTTAMVAGATVAYAVRKIAIGDRLPSGRYFIEINSPLNSS